MAYKDYIIENAIEELAQEVEKELKDVPFDKGLPLLRAKVDRVAERFNTTSVEIGKMYMEYMSKHNN